MEKNLGHATAYGYAKSKGYSGTEDEFAELMADYASVGQSAAQSAEQAAASAESASGSAATAASAAQTATSKASEAVTAAGTATTKASEANQSASTASAAATSASTSAQTATTAATTATAKASEASESAATATTAKADAETARDAAAQSAIAAAESARTLTIDATLTQSGQAADAKATGNAITELKDDLARLENCFNLSPNLFNPNDAITGLLRANNGVVDTSYTNYMASGYIPVDAGDSVRAQYTINDVRYDSGTNVQLSFYATAFYDSSKTFISDSGGNGVRVATAPANAKYLRFSLKNDKYNSVTDFAVIISDSSNVLPYSAYGNVQNIKESKIPDSYDSHIDERALAVVEGYDGYEITPQETTFFHISKNMIDPSARVTGEYVNQNSGVFDHNTGHTRTGYIAVEPSTTYVLRTEGGSAEFRYFFYDENKSPIASSGALLPASNDMLITSPATAKYVAVSLNTQVSPWMLALYANNEKSFERYDSVYIEPRYIPTGDVEFFNLPSKIYATTGLELNVYFSSLTEDWEQYIWKVTCDKGMQLERGYRITPTDSDTGTYSITFTMLNKYFEVLAEKTASLVIVAESAGSGETKSLIILGDSTTNNGTVIVKLHEDFLNDSMSITTLGTRGTAPNNHEGRAGWALQDYFTRESTGSGDDTVYNPWYNPTTQTFDAGYYFANSGIVQPDWLFINMGINDMFDMKTDATAISTADNCIGYLNAMITSVHEVSTNIKIGICVTIPPNDNQDAFGKAYKLRQTRNRYKRNNAILAEKIISTFSDMEDNGVYVIPIHLSLDTIYNMGLESLPVNNRNSMIYETPILNGGVHPAESGYWQIADVYTAFLKAHV